MTQAPTGPQVIPDDAPPLKTRIESLDVLRGIGILLALFTSVWIFGGFSDQQQGKLLLESKGFNYRLFGTVELLFAGKMSALIALVFGACMILFLAKETDSHIQKPHDVFIRRNLWLILLGIINSVALLWTHDILFHLGVMGVLLFVFFRMKPRALLISTLLLIAVYCGKNYWTYADDQKMYRKHLAVTALEKKYTSDSVAKAKTGVIAKKDTLTKLQQQDKQAWEGKLAAMKIDVKKDDPKKKAMRDHSYGKTWNHLLPETQNRQALWTYQFGVWDFGGMILLGMLLYKIGFFTNRFSRRRYLLAGLICIAGALLLGWYRLHHLQVGMRDYTKFITSHPLPYNFFFPIERAAMSLGYASMTMFLLPARILHYLWKGFAAAGRLALTNYILQTIFCTVFFYGYGMGFYGHLTQLQLYGFVVEIIIVQIVFSVLWLRYYNCGPAEWLLRRLSYGKRMPLRMRKTTDSPVPILS